ncbi:hypothetical protein GALMADRAFT_934755 [Galerina marginata CBS 339.88]|uniref:Uncharacterized protein n=1 Tax=Galerina marginata (strain CBS 339.88) TaxID=685588 RepID=A0A067SQR0_GALM3|nr:hypothetical protein GALMADRAFT_934755 [Galerina marginata CBS 339.88]
MSVRFLRPDPTRVSMTFELQKEERKNRLGIRFLTIRRGRLHFCIVRPSSAIESAFMTVHKRRTIKHSQYQVVSDAICICHFVTYPRLFVCLRQCRRMNTSEPLLKLLFAFDPTPADIPVTFVTESVASFLPSTRAYMKDSRASATDFGRLRCSSAPTISAGTNSDRQ